MLIKAERDQFFRLKPTACSEDNVTETYISTDFDTQTQSEYNYNDFDLQEQENVNFGHIRKLLLHLSRNHLESNDWKKLARFWDFTEDQIKGNVCVYIYIHIHIVTFKQFLTLSAIEHQYTGKSSYKDHAYRMLQIWLHGLSPCKNPLNELYEALIYINKHEVAEKIRRKGEESTSLNSSRFQCHCLPAIPSGVCHYCSII